MSCNTGVAHGSLGLRHNDNIMNTNKKVQFCSLIKHLITDQYQICSQSKPLRTCSNNDETQICYSNICNVILSWSH